MIYSLGHSTLEPPQFTELVKGRVDMVVDIRSHRTSKWEWFNGDKMEEWLPKVGVSYRHLPNLGGWTEKHLSRAKEMAEHGVDLRVYANGKFPKHHIAIDRDDGEGDGGFDGKPGPAWVNQGLYDYQWFTTIPEFWTDLKQLVEWGGQRRVAMMCSEVLWWKCHRSMVADVLWYCRWPIIHMQPEVVSHSDVMGNRFQRYEKPVIVAWHRQGRQAFGSQFEGRVA